MATPIKAIYDHGTLKLLEPLDLADGTEVEVVVLETVEDQSIENMLDIPPDIQAILDNPNSSTSDWLEAITRLPMSSDEVTDAGVNHDKYIYLHGRYGA